MEILVWFFSGFLFFFLRIELKRNVYRYVIYDIYKIFDDYFYIYIKYICIYIHCGLVVGGKVVKKNIIKILNCSDRSRFVRPRCPRAPSLAAGQRRRPLREDRDTWICPCLPRVVLEAAFRRCEDYMRECYTPQFPVERPELLQDVVSAHSNRRLRSQSIGPRPCVDGNFLFYFSPIKNCFFFFKIENFPSYSSIFIFSLFHFYLNFFFIWIIKSDFYSILFKK